MALEWKDEYSVGDEQMDEQHSGLFGLANRIETAELAQGNALVIELFESTRAHFSAEEAHMEQLGFPAAPEHAALHKHLITDLSDIVEIGVDDQDELDDVRVFYAEWLADHILRFDRRYYLFARKA
jgi:hemerythrin